MKLKYNGKPHVQLVEVERVAHSKDLFDEFVGLSFTFAQIQDLWADVCWEIEQAFQRGVSSQKSNKI